MGATQLYRASKYYCYPSRKSSRRTASITLDLFQAAGIGFDQTAIDGKTFAADQSFLNARAHDALEEAAQQVAVAEAPVATFGEGRVIRPLTIVSDPAEPEVCEGEVDLIAHPLLQADAEAVADNQHAHHQLGIDRRTAQSSVAWRESSPELIQFDKDRRR